MQCKRGVFFIFVALALFLAQFSFVAAAGAADRFTELVDGVGGFIKPVSDGVLGTATGTDELALQVLAFLLVALVVYGILSMVSFFGPGKEWINVIIGIIIAIIGVRFMPDNFLQAATLPSSAMVLFLVLVVPFFAAFYIIHKSVTNPMVRRALWAVYGVLVLVLWGYNVANNPSAVVTWMYPLILAGIVIAFAFDGTLQKMWNKARTDQMLAEGAQDQIDRLLGEITALEAKLAGGVTNPTLVASYTRQIDQLKRNLNKLQGVSTSKWTWDVILMIIAGLIGIAILLWIFWSQIAEFLGFQ